MRHRAFAEALSSGLPRDEREVAVRRRRAPRGVVRIRVSGTTARTARSSQVRDAVDPVHSQGSRWPAGRLEHRIGGRLKTALAGLKGRVVRVHARLYGEAGRCTRSPGPSVTAATRAEAALHSGLGGLQRTEAGDTPVVRPFLSASIYRVSPEHLRLRRRRLQPVVRPRTGVWRNGF